MAFINAVKDGKAIRVSKEAFKNIFEPLGYMDVSSDTDWGEAETEEMTIDATEPEDEEEIPISDMNQAQLREFAEKHGIDLSGVTKFRDAKKRVQEFVRENNKK